jgi:hypothetical protein
MDNLKNVDLPVQEKRSIIEQRIINYKRKIFELKLDYTAFEATNDNEAMVETEKRIEYLSKAIEAILKIKVEG